MSSVDKNLKQSELSSGPTVRMFWSESKLFGELDKKIKKQKQKNNYIELCVLFACLI